MANPIRFEHQTVELQAPEGAKGVAPLPVWTDGRQVVSCWKLSWRERLSALLFGRVWVAVLSGHTQPPVFIRAVRTFLRKNPDASRRA
jgi:hypothetical protein